MGLAFYTATHEPTEVGCNYAGWRNFTWAVGDAIGLARITHPGGRWDWAHPWPNSPLVQLCRYETDGSIDPRTCGDIAPALKEVGAKLPDGWMRKFADELATLMQECADEDKWLIFS